MFQKFSKVILATCAALIVSSSTVSYAAPEPFKVNITINGKALVLDPGAYIENDRTLVPIAQISQAVFADVFWVEDSRSVILRRGVTAAKMQIGYDYVSSSNYGDVKFQKLDTCPQIIEDRTYIPLSAVTYALGCDLVWHQDTKTAAITLPQVTSNASIRPTTVTVANAETGLAETTTISKYNVIEPAFPLEVFGYIPTNDPIYRDSAMTSGSENVDFLLDTILGNILYSGMSETDELRAVYRYVVENCDHNYDYADTLKTKNYYLFQPTDATSLGGLAYDALMTGEGTSIHIASLFTAMTGRLGYPSFRMAGTYINSDNSQMEHYWSAVELNGQIYHFDPDIESVLRVYEGYSSVQFYKFMQDVETSKQFHVWDFTNTKSNTSSMWSEYST